MIPVEIDDGGRQHWLIIAVRHRKDVYDELQVAVNRVTGELKFVDLSVMGDSSLRRAGITLTPAEPDDTPAPAPIPEPDPVPDRPALLSAYTADQLRDLGVAEQPARQSRRRQSLQPTSQPTHLDIHGSPGEMTIAQDLRRSLRFQQQRRGPPMKPGRT